MKTRYIFFTILLILLSLPDLSSAQGHGVPQDYAEAMKWFRKAAEQGDAQAQRNLGIMYHGGQGVSQDYGEAMKWFRKAAEQGDAQAQNNLAWLLATCPDDQIRDGERALSIAKNLVANDPSAMPLDTLAAAYAELGRFDDAMHTQEEAITKLKKDENESERIKNYRERLHAYRDRKPWREP